MLQKYDYILIKQVFTVLLFIFYKIMACNTSVKPANTGFAGLINKKDF